MNEKSHSQNSKPETQNPKPVVLVGAGPGDPGLLTLRGQGVLQNADVIFYDALVNDEILKWARADAEIVFVGKRAGRHALRQDEINALIIAAAQRGKRVCRLKGGDPFVFGRGGEEALACFENEIPFEIVPGISSAIAAPAYAGIPVTHREDENFAGATSFAVVTGHTKNDDAPPENLPTADTLIFLMGVRALGKIVASLIASGRAGSTPVALVRWGTTSEQEVVTGTLDSIESDVEKAGLKPPALIVVGEVVRLRQKLSWFDNAKSKPLWNQNIVVTRAREQASSLVLELEKKGARVVQCPTIKIESLRDLEYSRLDEAIGNLAVFDWLVFTSTNGVEKFWERLETHKKDARALGNNSIASIGPATKEALKARGISADFLPDSSISENVAEGLIQLGAKKVLILRALEGREVLPETLLASGVKATVAPCYRSASDDSNAQMVREKLASGEIDWITFTSSSTVSNFVEAIGPGVLQAARPTFRVACIGPITEKTALENGLQPDVVANEASVEALAGAIAAFAAP